MTEAVRLLAVDDSPGIRALLQTIFVAAGCEVFTADGTREALRTLRAFEPDVILTDFNMPGLNGEAFVRLVRRDPRFAETPVFVVSSVVAIDIRRRMEAAGADAWFGKPIDVFAIMQAVRLIAEARLTATVRRTDCARALGRTARSAQL